MNPILKPTAAALAALLAILTPDQATAATDYFRLSWRADPSSTMVVGWRQNGGSSPVVHYGTTDHGTNYASYPLSATPARTTTAKGMTHSFARLAGLSPDTAYYFVVRDSSGTSARMWFRTAPTVAKDLTYITGGDSRNNRTPRQQANQMVSKLRPLFVLFGGDYTDGNTNTEWADWFADWQQTKSTDGRMYPIIAARGNHDDNLSLVDMFDIPNANVYYALNVGGSFMRLYTLNSEITAGGTQGTWLSDDLAANTAAKWKIAQYHKPMFPHESAKAENTAIYSAWAQPFYDHAMSLVSESDSHCVKTTWPVRPTGSTSSASAFTRDDANGTVYVGEGCWGAPLRSANDNKSYTRNSESFNNLMWVHAYQDRMELRTIDVANVSSVASVSDSNPFALPSGLNVWNPSNGGVITMYPRDAGTPGNVAPTVALTAPSSGGSFTAPAAITVSANAADSDGSVTGVEFLANGSVIGSDSTSPYSISWSSVPAGSYTVTARATDNQGSITTSANVGITVVPGAGSTVVSLQNGTNGYSGATDTKIRSNAATTNYGTATSIEIDGSPDYAGLIRWNLSSIPAGKTVTAASITVNVTDVTTEAYEIYALRRNWTPSQATWNIAASGANWGTPGASNTSTDRESTVLGTMSSSTTGLKTFALNASGVAKVQSWVNSPSSNHGFIIMDYVNNSNGLDFSSSEDTAAANRPKLTVTYE
ncbi:DNRLRE domain-containing protein [Luteolibacter arcticus]|uniref:DNRLRE domain-containing protein n=1 Tax=Luteolibacter arcticus TaxID=1581411 RepID=A0ABT3GNB2_9BACT|nr:DNRLRE domain-containing protein [Luteolibacter arcticus]MCW1925015.1 DNRLRE domain-containing protein [Luteolibacter arcticus]